MKFTFNWRDLWVGLYVSKDRRMVWICPVPCIAIGIRIKKPLVTSDEWMAKWDHELRSPEQD